MAADQAKKLKYPSIEGQGSLNCRFSLTELQNFYFVIVSKAWATHYLFHSTFTFLLLADKRNSTNNPVSETM